MYVSDLVEVDELGIKDAIERLDLLEECGRDVVVDRQDHEVLALFLRRADLHGRDVDAIAAEQRADRADDARAVDVRADQDARMRVDVDAEVIDADGWFHTGDIARVEEDGYMYLTGRKKNVIILDSGENVSPEELEGIVGKCEAVKECVVKEMGQKIGVVVYCDEDKQQQVRDFITEANRTLPLYKRMSAVEFSTEPLPRNGAGKLLRQ